MISVDIQIHGYRKGHQLLASSVVLPKEDQAVIDRLSDVAGPLRPKEVFEPYLSAYPLPSGHHYVLARTWQDVTVARAGCVRTLSLIVESDAWSSLLSLESLVDLLSLTRLPEEEDARRVSVSGRLPRSLEPTPAFNGNELLEALFLEDSKAVALFDAPAPELIAIRLLTALWPSLRRRFAVSTFALSPRKVAGRDFDLVFAPGSARAKFANWPGRRVDGRSSPTGRHRWTGTIAARVFADAEPRLMTEDDLGLLDNPDGEDATSLRIALLWDELMGKLEGSPTAVLGLLDIANSGKVSNEIALHLLEPLMVRAIRSAGRKLDAKSGWDFAGAVARKLHGLSMRQGHFAVGSLVTELAAREPEGGIALLLQDDPKGAIYDLLPNVAAGIGGSPAGKAERALYEAPSDLLLRLIVESAPLTSRAAGDDRLIDRLAELLKDGSSPLITDAAAKLLPHLTEDWQLSAAYPIFVRLDADGTKAELARLGEANGFKADALCDVLLQHARHIGAIAGARDVLLAQATEKAIQLLVRTIQPTGEDVAWLLADLRLSREFSSMLLAAICRQANDREFARIFSETRMDEWVVDRMPADATDILARAVLQDGLAIDAYAQLVRSVMPKFDADLQQRIAHHVLGRLLREGFRGDQVGTLVSLFDALRESFEGEWAVRVGLGRSVSADVAGRNLIAFEQAGSRPRAKLVKSVDHIAIALRERWSLDLSEQAFGACAALMLDAENAARGEAMNAAGRLVPFLLRSRHEPVSRVIAVLFPLIYRELAKADDVPDLLKFVPFMDWDRCKAARHELVSAFLGSKWFPGDLALTAYRCGDPLKILRRVAKSNGGQNYLRHIEKDLDRVPVACRTATLRAIAAIRSDKSFRLDW